jgi:very-short-patch-repair endonuclease
MSEDKLRTLADRYLDRQERILNALLRRCESPIEQMLLTAFFVGSESGSAPWPGDVPGWTPDLGEVYVGELRFDPVGYHDFEFDTPRVGIQHARDSLVGVARLEGVLLVQHEVTVGNKDYRLDFAVVGWSDDGQVPYRIAIDVDGHDFHERTKEQAARDRSRDRALLCAGWQVLRFTGSEVYRDATGCVGQVAAAIEMTELRRKRWRAEFALATMRDAAEGKQ